MVEMAKHASQANELMQGNLTVLLEEWSCHWIPDFVVAHTLQLQHAGSLLHDHQLQPVQTLCHHLGERSECSGRPDLDRESESARRQNCSRQHCCPCYREMIASACQVCQH